MPSSNGSKRGTIANEDTAPWDTSARQPSRPNRTDCEPQRARIGWGRSGTGRTGELSFAVERPRRRPPTAWRAWYTVAGTISFSVPHLKIRLIVPTCLLTVLRHNFRPTKTSRTALSFSGPNVLTGSAAYSSQSGTAASLMLCKWLVAWPFFVYTISASAR